MGSSRGLDCIILDFDGVVIDSVDIKTEVFKEIFSRFPEIFEDAVSYHLNNIGISRHAKFAYLLKNFLRHENIESEAEKLSCEFSEKIYRKIVNCPYINGSLEFLKKYSEIVPLYLVSTTPQNELSSIIQERGLNKFFKNIVGSAKEKSSIILNIVEGNGFQKEKVFYFGDTKYDLQAAKVSGVNFIGIVSGESGNPFPVNAFVLKDLAEVTTYIEKNFY